MWSLFCNQKNILLTAEGQPRDAAQTEVFSTSLLNYLNRRATRAIFLIIFSFGIFGSGLMLQIVIFIKINGMDDEWFSPLPNHINHGLYTLN